MLIIGTKEGNQSLEKTANYELNEGDHKNIVVFTSATDVICTIPKGLRIGFSCTIVQKGAGKVSFSAPAAETDVNGGNNTIQTKGAWAWAKVLCISASDYTVEFGGAGDGSGAAGTLSEVLTKGYTAPTQTLLVRRATVDKAHGVDFANGPDVIANTGTTVLKALENNQDNDTTLYLPKNVTNKKLAVSIDGSFADDNGDIQMPNVIRLKNGFLWKIPTTQGENASGAQPYGNYFFTLDEGYTNPDGQKDAVMQWGYNQNGGGGKVNVNEAAFHLAIESHFQAGGAHQFEFHIQSVAKDGSVNRHLSINPSKINGSTNTYMTADTFDLRSTVINGNIIYFSVNVAAQATIQGTGARLDILNTTPGNGNLRIETQEAGDVLYQNSSNGNLNFATGGGNISFANGAGNLLLLAAGNVDFFANTFKIKGNNGVIFNLYSNSSTEPTFTIYAAGGNNGDNYCQIGNSSAAICFDTRGGIAPYRFLVGNTDAMDIFSSGGIGMGTLNVEDVTVKLKVVGKLNVTNTPDYADNAAAAAAGLTVGTIYRTGDLLKIVH